MIVSSAFSFATRSARRPPWTCAIDSRRCLPIFSSTASSCVSSSVMRSSTSRCLTAAMIRRMVPRRSLSPDRIAAFMSSWMRSLRLIGYTLARATGGSGWQAAPLALRSRAGGAREIARYALHMPLDGGGLLAFSFLRGLLVEFAPSQLGEHACLLTRPFETPQGGVEILVLAYSNTRHRNPNLLIAKLFWFPAVRARAAILMSLPVKGKMKGRHAHSGD